MDRDPGLSVRLKLTLSYAGFLMLAGGLLLGAVWLFILRYVPDRAFLRSADDADRFDAAANGVFPVRSNLVEIFAPRAAVVMAFLLLFGLVGGWVLAGRMLAPLARITDATRIAANGSLSHRIQLPGRGDEFRELADAFDTMLARLEAHVAEQQRFEPTPPTNCAPRSRSPRHCSTSPSKIRIATATNSSTASTRSTPERSTSPKHCFCSAAPTNGASPQNTPTCPS